jgi:hypothetical protein
VRLSSLDWWLSCLGRVRANKLVSEHGFVLSFLQLIFLVIVDVVFCCLICSAVVLNHRFAICLRWALHKYQTVETRFVLWAASVDQRFISSSWGQWAETIPLQIVLVCFAVWTTWMHQAYLQFGDRPSHTQLRKKIIMDFMVIRSRPFINTYGTSNFKVIWRIWCLYNRFMIIWRFKYWMVLIYVVWVIWLIWRFC